MPSVNRQQAAPTPLRNDGARAILRVPEVLLAVASNAGGSTFSQIREAVGSPKSSLHRMLRTLEFGGYLTERSGVYFLGPAATKLARGLSLAAPPDDFPGLVRPVLEWLARETHESIILATLAGDRKQVLYIDVINSEIPLRFSVPTGNSRPLYAAASGQAILAFLSSGEQAHYLETTEFIPFTEETLDEAGLRARLREALETAVAFDRNGSFPGASGLASPCFDAVGNVRCAISIAGPTERIEGAKERFLRLSVAAGERISRRLGYGGPYPARP